MQAVDKQCAQRQRRAPAAPRQRACQADQGASLPARLTHPLHCLPAVTAVFSRYDALRLERVVGAARAAKMLKQRKTGTFLFC